MFGDRIRIWTEEDLDADFRERIKMHYVTGSQVLSIVCR